MSPSRLTRLREAFLQQENNSAQYPLPDNEEERLAALQEYRLLDTPLSKTSNV